MAQGSPPAWFALSCGRSFWSPQPPNGGKSERALPTLAPVINLTGGLGLSASDFWPGPCPESGHDCPVSYSKPPLGVQWAPETFHFQAHRCVPPSPTCSSPNHPMSTKDQALPSGQAEHFPPHLPATPPSSLGWNQPDIAASGPLHGPFPISGMLPQPPPVSAQLAPTPSLMFFLHGSCHHLLHYIFD